MPIKKHAQRRAHMPHLAKMSVAVLAVAVLVPALGCRHRSLGVQQGATVEKPAPAPAAAPTVPPDALTGTKWKWVRLVTPTETLEIPVPDRYTLEFLPDRQAAIRLDCNRGTGSYETDGKSLAFAQLLTTRRMCPPNSLETRYLRTLDSAASWSLQGGDLHIALKGDAGTMQFKPL
jgi:heat shock protein HslJ